MNRNMSDSERMGIAIAVVLLSVVAYFVFNPGLIEKMWIVVSQNASLWIACVVGIGYAFVRRHRHPDQLVWAEMPVQIAVTCTAITLFYLFFFYTATDLKDTEIWNGYVQKAEYYEEWTEEVETCTTSCDSDGSNCTTSCTTILVYHPPEWQIVTTVGTVSTSQEIYHRYINTTGFGEETFHTLIHMNQVSIGDGNMYVVRFEGSFEQRISASSERQYVNYVKGSQSIHKRSGGATEQFAQFIVEFPRVHGGPLGNIEFDRVIAASVTVPRVWSNQLDNVLDLALTDLGRKKECNILVYVVGTADQAFLHGLEEAWVNGNKNDIILLVGTTSFPKIEWVAVMAWTDIEEFKIELRDQVLAMGSLPIDGKILANTIIAQVSKPPKDGGYLRKSMEDFEYLAGDVQLPWWAHLLVIGLSFAIAWATSWALINNTIGHRSRSHDNRFGNRRNR